MIKLFSESADYKLYDGDMLDMLDVIEKNSIDAIVTDPPYGLTSITKRFGKENSAKCQFGTDGSFQRLSRGFMGKEWDGTGIEYNIDTWRKCYDVLKDGGYMLVFGGTRTFHRIACAIEDAGFEIRDTIMWLYGSGFPKSNDIGLKLDKRNKIETKTIKKLPTNGIINYEKEGWRKGGYDISYNVCKASNEWAGWSTCLKPSYEPIIVARKPFKGSLLDNILKNGVGAINIDECRVFGNDTEKLQKNWTNRKAPAGFNGDKSGIYGSGKTDNVIKYTPAGRFPANTILTYDETDFDEVCGGLPNTKNKNTRGTFSGKNEPSKNINIGGGVITSYYDDSGSASRYFYCAKASKKDRDEGLDNFELKSKTITSNNGRSFNDRCGICGKKFIGSYDTICHCENPITDKTNSAVSRNIHPTVKPTTLMQYLIRLVTPNGGIVLDPFNGSGSTGKAVMYENLENNKQYKYIGIELEKDYLVISKARIEYVKGGDSSDN